MASLKFNGAIIVLKA